MAFFIKKNNTMSKNKIITIVIISCTSLMVLLKIFNVVNYNWLIVTSPLTITIAIWLCWLFFMVLMWYYYYIKNNF